MSIRIRYFASLKESLGRSEDQLPFTGQLTVRSLWHQANPEKAMPENTLAAVNMDYVGLDDIVTNDGDEVAFFPPVTGG